MELVLFYLAVGFWQFAPGWAKALLYASPLLLSLIPIRRCRRSYALHIASVGGF